MERRDIPPPVRAFLVALFVAIVLVRVPAVMTTGRFWAEEGVIYFRDAWYLAWPDALFAVHAGYLNLPASLAALLALHTVPLGHAPLVTALVAITVQTLPAILIATGRIPWLRRWPALAAALVLPLIPAGGAEVWVNTITSQFHLALCAGLILAMDVRRGWPGAFRAAVLLLTPLAGPLGGCLVPLFLLRAALDRSLARLVQAVLLGMPLLVQAIVLLTHAEPHRSSGIGLPLLAAVAGLQDVILPFLGQDRTAAIAVAAVRSFREGGVPALPVIAGIAGLGGLGLVVGWRGTPAARWLVAGGCLLTAVSYSFALTVGDPLQLLTWLGGRYAFAPTVLLSLALLQLATTGTWRARAVPMVLAGMVLTTGAAGYFDNLGLFAAGADWRTEIARWRHDPATLIHVWPDGWPAYLTLDPALRPGR